MTLLVPLRRSGMAFRVVASLIPVAVLAAIACGAAAEVAATPHWVHGGEAVACRVLKDFAEYERRWAPWKEPKEMAKVKAAYIGKGKCITLTESDTLMWDGKELPYKVGETIPAKVSITGRDGEWFTAARRLRRISMEALKIEQYETARDVAMCPAMTALDDGLKALSLGDTQWFDRLGCALVAPGARVVRLDPALSYTHQNWRMRVYGAHGEGDTLYGWIMPGDLRPR